MTMNIGSGYPMMMGGMGMGMGLGMGMNTGGNVPQYFQAKYGCEDCFRKEPYWQEYPKPVSPEPKGALKPSFFRRFLNNVLGG